MFHNKTVEVWVGFFVAAGMAALFMLAMQVSDLSDMDSDDGYRIYARFENIGGLKTRAPVSVAGVRIGRVEDIDFDSETFEAVVALRISGRYDKLPADTSASIYTTGLLGEQYVSLEPGGAEEVLGEGDTLPLTQSALVMEQVISQFLFSQASEEEEKKEPFRLK
jgi:phospholipid/cholesterol/gamma-HCH transport system substrate-binding protein